MMNHLSNNDIHSLIDGMMLNGERSRVLAHLEDCERCRREVAFHRSATRVAREMPPVKPSSRFTERVMIKVAPREQPAWLRWTLNNAGNIFGMILVLSVIGYLLTTPMVFTEQSSGGSSKLTETFQTYQGLYGQAKTFLAEQANKLKGDPSTASTPPTESGKILVMVVLSLLMLVGLDRFVFRRISRVRMR
ncbi:MAG: zf-HC2 domain-containing protein [Bacteroidota bacterium]